MKKILCIGSMALMLMACNNSEEKAQACLQQAKQLFEQGAYSEAKSQIDSIRMLYPKAFEARKAGIKLMQQIELREQARTLAYLDSAYQVKIAAFDSIKGNYVLEKDTAYQEVGNYFSPSQTVEKNINRTYLRAQVSEQGIMSLTSIYCGKGNIHHTAVKVSSGDTFAQTPSSNDVYETSDLGWKIEKADYVLGKDSSVIDYIVLHKNDPIRVEFIGDKTYRTTLQASDRKAIASVYELAKVLSALEQIKKDQKEANLKVEFIRRKMQEDKGTK